MNDPFHEPTSKLEEPKFLVTTTKKPTVIIKVHFYATHLNSQWLCDWWQQKKHRVTLICVFRVQKKHRCHRHIHIVYLLKIIDIIHKYESTWLLHNGLTMLLNWFRMKGSMLKIQVYIMQITVMHISYRPQHTI